MRVVRDQRPWTVRALRERCQHLRRSLTARGTDASECAAYWPGGAENPTRDRGAWVHCYANLVGMLRVADLHAAPGRADGAIAAALAAEPASVTLSDGTVRTVQPKSYHALRWLDTLDHTVQGWAGLMASLRPDAPEELKALALAPLAESLAVRLWAWVITEGLPDAPAALPFDEDAAPAPPAWTSRLTPEDLLTLARAHAEVNGHRLRIIAEAFPSDRTGGSRLPLSGFLGTAAQELGQRPATLLRQWSLGEVFAQAIAAAQAAREARESAELAASVRRSA